MFIKAYKLTYTIKAPWHTYLQYKYFSNIDGANLFIQKYNPEKPIITEVAFIRIEDKYYCLGEPIILDN